MREQTPPIPDIVAAFDADALTPEIIAAWAHHPHVCIGTLELACLDILSARCTALEQERDKWASQTVRLACFTTWLGVPMDANLEDAVTQSIVRARASASKQAESRCQHLEQAVRAFLDAWNAPNAGVERQVDALASLLPSQDETPRTDENRVSFAAGYTAALDDALKGKTHD